MPRDSSSLRVMSMLKSALPHRPLASYRATSRPSTRNSAASVSLLYTCSPCCNSKNATSPISQALGILRRMHHLQLADLSNINHEGERLPWDIFDHLDRQLVAGLDPHRDQTLRLRLMLGTCARLTQTARAPGMGLTPVLQIATTLTGIDPPWGWKDILLNPSPNTRLDHALYQFVLERCTWAGTTTDGFEPIAGV